MADPRRSGDARRGTAARCWCRRWNPGRWPRVDQHSKFHETRGVAWNARPTSWSRTTYGDTADGGGGRGARPQGARADPRHRPGHRRAVRGRRPRPVALDPRGRGRVVPARLPHLRGSASPTPTPTGTSPRWRASRRWSNCRRAGRRSPRVTCATTCARCGAARHPGARSTGCGVVHASRRCLPPTVRCGRSPRRRRSRLLPGYTRRMYRIPWFPPVALPVRTAVFALSRVLNLVTPTPPALRDARAAGAAAAAA